MAKQWTCDGCGVTVSFQDPAQAPEQPAGWAKSGRTWLCLNCRREEVAAAISGETEAKTKGARRRALTEFELLRDPTAPDGEIAKRVRCATVHVKPIRAELQKAGKLPA
jgi:hypothetical protein